MSGSIPNAAYLDGTCPITIVDGDKFYVRGFIVNAAGIVFQNGVVGNTNVPGNFAFGDVFDAAVSGLSDNTLGGAYTASSGITRYSPMIIAARTRKPSILVIGDSKGYGENDTGDTSGDIGEVQRWISPSFANACWAIRGRDASQFNANSAIQASMASFFTHLINEDGINGFIHGRSAAQIAIDTDTLAARFPTLKKLLVTILPAPTSTDSYATLVNQTPPSYEAGRVTENTRRRGVPSPWLGCFDSASAVESSPNSGLVAAGLGYYTTSSVHPKQAGYLAIKATNEVNIGLI
ncbi:hypothetical protein [Bradyrhizobium sp. F1.13.3]|uniref:hypothetical protein n=1 Tax=Bradyrhizobium sp. F1.13.3 TaxID=3156351 RepID=UPI00339305D1